jgi:elongation factor 1-alpha
MLRFSSSMRLAMVSKRELPNKARLAYTLGIEQLIIADSDSDAEPVQNAKSRYDEIVDELTRIVPGLGLGPEMYKFLLVSGLVGDNIIKESLNLSWYSAGTLLENLDAPVPPKRAFDRPLRLPVQDVYDISGIEMHPAAPAEAVPGDNNGFKRV